MVTVVGVWVAAMLVWREMVGVVVVGVVVVGVAVVRLSGGERRAAVLVMSTAPTSV